MADITGNFSSPEPCQFEVPIRLKVPIYLDLEVKATPPVCYPSNGQKPTLLPEEKLAPELIKTSE